MNEIYILLTSFEATLMLLISWLSIGIYQTGKFTYQLGVSAGFHIAKFITDKFLGEK